jgi:hypothetical protein
MGQGDVNPSGYTRIDIAGPAPFNKLVFCNLGGPPISNVTANVKRATVRLTSTFKLDGFAQSNPPPVFKHSSIGWLASTSLGNSETTNNGPDAWLWAMDAVVDAGFDADGHFFVVVDIAFMMPLQDIDPRYEDGGFMVFSYVLIQEPQPTSKPKHLPHGPQHGLPKGAQINEHT